MKTYITPLGENVNYEKKNYYVWSKWNLTIRFVKSTLNVFLIFQTIKYLIFKLRSQIISLTWNDYLHVIFTLLCLGCITRVYIRINTERKAENININIAERENTRSIFNPYNIFFFFVFYLILEKKDFMEFFSSY